MAVATPLTDDTDLQLAAAFRHSLATLEQQGPPLANRDAATARYLLNASGVSTETAALALHVSVDSVRSWCQGKYNPSTDRWQHFLSLLAQRLAIQGLPTTAQDEARQ